MYIERLNRLFLAVLFIIAAQSINPSRLEAVPCSKKKALNRKKAYKDCKMLDKGKVFLGGKAPRLLRMDLFKKVMNPETGRYAYQYKALVKRAGKEKNGSGVFFRAKTYGDALAQLLQVHPSDKAVFDLFFPESADKRAFPDLKIEYYYVLSAQEEGGAPDRISYGARKTKGKRKFLEYMNLGLEPGTYVISLSADVSLAEHEITDMYDRLEWFLFIYDIPGSLKSSVTDWFSITGLGKKVLWRLISEALFSTLPKWRFEVKAQVPKVKGLKPSEAVKSLSEHSLGYKVKDVYSSGRGYKCNAKKVNKVVAQKPRPKSLLKKDKEVKLTVCRTKVAPTPTPEVTPAPDALMYKGTWYCPGYGKLALDVQSNEAGDILVNGGTAAANESGPWAQPTSRGVYRKENTYWFDGLSAYFILKHQDACDCYTCEGEDVCRPDAFCGVYWNIDTSGQNLRGEMSCSYNLSITPATSSANLTCSKVSDYPDF